MRKEREITVEDALREGLTKEEFSRIIELLGRKPNYTELGIFAVLWSEHCSYKSSRVYLKRLPTTSPRVLQGPGENAGVVAIDSDLALAFKIESHNHPSYIEPYQGAATGVGGILRDVFTMGARPIASLNSLRFGDPSHPRTRYLLEQVVAGIADYGNCMGIPTVGGEVYFDHSYNGNILVNAFTIGLVDPKRIIKAKAEGEGNPVFYIGAKTGRDGIHGAGLLASSSFDEEAEEKRPTVQVGDPFYEKLLLEAVMELSGSPGVIALQDMGAAGLASSSFEMASRGGVGMELFLDRVPVREPAMTPYELMLSESQERMLLVVKRGYEEEVIRVLRKWGLDAAEIGVVTSDGAITLKKDGEVVAKLPVSAVVDEAPRYERPMRRPGYLDELEIDYDKLPPPSDYNEVLAKLLSSPNLSSRSWIFTQYDHMVGTNTVIRPGADSALLRIKGRKEGIAITVDGNSTYTYLDPELGAAIAVAEAARNLACVGAEPIGLTDCLNYGSPERPEVMWQFVKGIEGIRNACLALGVPVVSGNVSFYNETREKAIDPTPIIAMVGLLPDMEIHATPWFKHEGDVIILLGDISREELGGSEYLKLIHKLKKGKPPELDLVLEGRLGALLREGIGRRLFSSVHDVSEGGIATALAECGFLPSGEVLGAEVELPSPSFRADGLLFGESQSRVIISLPRENLGEAFKLAEEKRIPLEVIGRVGGKRLRIASGGRILIDTGLSFLRKGWEEFLPQFISRGR
ncbi:MAG: phosphoribosylformylglycinamidine synthase subunit PurL [Acidobacteria bacterium]|nr:phosphoribosylformylglycinamidine synthase subunit PurL [Acidobacteriota bacterium]